MLIGENGAGKSTLMRILAGVETADEGELLLDGVPLRLRSPREAAAHGISIVHQELSVLPNLDISENIFAGREPVRSGILLDRPKEDRRAASALATLRKPMPTRIKTAQLALAAVRLSKLPGRSIREPRSLSWMSQHQRYPPLKQNLCSE